MIVLVDNYDSFVFNLARYFERLGQPTRVVRNDAIDAEGLRALKPDALVLSPGPCTPNEAGCSLELVQQLYQEIPILGVCLGHQAIAVALGGQIVRATEPVHGRTSQIHHDGRGIFTGLPTPLVACRYHSLVVDRSSLPECLEVSAWIDDGPEVNGPEATTVMALRHKNLPIIGLQFHPESILTESGYPLLASFLRRIGLPVPPGAVNFDDEYIKPPPETYPLPKRPVTF